MIAIVVFGVTCLLVILVNTRFQDLLSPLSVMLIVWGMSLSLYYLKLLYFVDLHFYATFLIFASLVSFAGGFLVVAWRRQPWMGRKRNVLITRQKVEPKARPQQKTYAVPLLERLQETLSASRLFALCIILFAIGMFGQVGFLNEVDQVVGLSYSIENPQALHFATTVGDLKNLGLTGLAATTNRVNVVIFLCYIVIFGRQHRYRLAVMIAFLFLSLAAILFSTSRTGIFIPVIWSFVAYFYLIGGLRLQFRSSLYVILALVFLVMIFLGISSLIGKTEGAEGYRPYWQSDLPFNSGLASLYFYTTSAIPAFQTFVESTHHFLGGQSTFLPVFRVAQLVVPSMTLVETIRSFVFVPMPTNVFTYLAPFYEDFGTLGVVLLPGMFGAICGFFYTRMRERPTLALLLFTSLLTTTIFWGIFQSIMVFIVIWYYAAVVVVVGTIARKPQRLYRLSQIRL